MAERETPPEPEYLMGRIEQALATDGRVLDQGLTVSVRGARVYVSGTVSTPERRSAVEAVVREVAPAVELHNDTVVVSLDEPEGGETLR